MNAVHDFPTAATERETLARLVDRFRLPSVAGRPAGGPQPLGTILTGLIADCRS